MTLGVSRGLTSAFYIRLAVASGGAFDLLNMTDAGHRHPEPFLH